MLEQVQTQSSRAADGAQHAADAARHTADWLREQEAWMAGLVEQGADRLGDFARTLRQAPAGSVRRRRDGARICADACSWDDSDGSRRSRWHHAGRNPS